MSHIQKITPNLWYDGNALEAAEYYVSIFPDSRIDEVVKYPHEGLADFQRELAGKPLTVMFSIAGQQFTAINAGPEFKFNESVSFLVNCKDQEEIDYYWEKLSAVPENEQCGWCKDRYGLSWQVVPESMDDMMRGNDGAPNPAAFSAMMQMKKIVIEDLISASKTS